MKIMAICILILAATINLTAPGMSFAVIAESKPIGMFNISDPFLMSVVKFESNFDPDAVNPYTGARGILQILPIMVNEVNKFSDVQYTWNDAFDPEKSIEIWYKVMKKYNPEYFPDKAIRIWFGTGRQYDGMRWEDYYMIVMK